MNIEETLKEFDEKKLAKLISDLVWEATDGGQKIESSRFLSYQDEPLASFEKIKHFLISFHIRLMEEMVERLKTQITDERKVAIFGEWEARTYEDKMLVNAVIQDQISHLEQKITHYNNLIK